MSEQRETTETAWVKFDELSERLRYVRALSDEHALALEAFYRENLGGFVRLVADDRPRGTFSVASTATCVLSLRAAGRWHSKGAPWIGQEAALANAFLRAGSTSADLDADNVFTTAFGLEAAALLLEETDFDDDVHTPLVARAQHVLLWGRAPGTPPERPRPENQTGLLEGGLRLDRYPESAFLTQLGVRALRRSTRLPQARTQHAHVELALRKTREWARSTLLEELAFLGCGRPSGDIFQAAYAALIYADLTSPQQLGQSEGRLLASALHHFFDAQEPDGSWPRSRPQFHYPEVGAAFVYEYELLAQLLESAALAPYLQPHLPKLVLAAERLVATAYMLPSTRKAAGGRAWSSGHHPQTPDPESWATASAYHFLHGLMRAAAETFRRQTFSYLGQVYKEPGEPAPGPFARDFLDCDLHVADETWSLKDTLRDRLVLPVLAQREELERGLALRDVATTGILFGPPGTSKSKIAGIVADQLGWPLLELDPTHFLRRGLDGVQAEADRIFRMLSSLERVVILLDEVDEMVRARDQADDVFSRFLTTAMLPKLAKIHEQGRTIFLVATNYIGHFDFAIQRPGRFDVVLQVLPPRVEAKYRRWPELERIARRLDRDLHHADVPKRLNELTFLECKILVKELAGLPSEPDQLSAIRRAHERCTMETLTTTQAAAMTWREASQEERRWVRV